MNEFSANFQEPLPPKVHTEFSASFVQHKWNANLSHITSGWIQFSAEHQYVRALEAFEGNLASSAFDFSNKTSNGQVSNVMITYEANSTRPSVWTGYVDPGFPIFQPRILLDSQAVFSGLVQRPFFNDKVASWNILYGGELPTTVYTTDCGVVIGYDFFSPSLRTRAITQFFNIEVY
ncbi:hypothetical protein M409DRAFT_28227 [Zasmidium cellare ATCC 36951]|uniref:Uncharacterized protein n=1 Tax=Zasmidium cellare ATCC 36951 TaxID=1080233 RepID=A0A6A6C6W4_ZASCE|nr:uncharacterized protein M409DRAFT_28227 [Zasmidium cellare ATCC 36951]KAF2161499.1 hypothetical protein M409DRAFT_28227 [Zasmidium cellare ATCC 36951]